MMIVERCLYSQPQINYIDITALSKLDYIPLFKKPFLLNFAANFLLFSLVLAFCCEKKLKFNISTGVLGVQHPFAGPNIQQLGAQLFIKTETESFKTNIFG